MYVVRYLHVLYVSRLGWIYVDSGCLVASAVRSSSVSKTEKVTEPKGCMSGCVFGTGYHRV